MLKSIECDSFVSNRQPRKRIDFKSGLNVLLGEDNGKNSIGKSTFLLALDCCFGGKRYMEKAKNFNNVGYHTIKFCFEFDGVSYYFSRSTKTTNEVLCWDKDYKEIEASYSLEEFNDLLCKHYRLTENKATFRKLIGCFMRIYGTPNCNVENLLGETKNKGGVTAILTNLIKLFNQYEIIEEIEKQQQEENKLEVEYSNISNSNITDIGQIKTKTQKKKKEKQLEALKEKLEFFEIPNKTELEKLEINEIEKIAEIKKEITRLKRKQTNLLNEKKLIELNFVDNTTIKEEDFNGLKLFFPNVNIAHINEVQNFHKAIRSILEKETSEEKEKITQQIAENELQILSLAQQITENVDIQKKVLEEYASIKQEIVNIERELEFYNEMQECKLENKKINKSLSDKKLEVLKKIEADINFELESISQKICGEDAFSPTIEFLSAASYIYTNKNDDGTGANYINLLMFDLCMLKLTKLPVVIHDSLLFKNIEDKRVENVFKEYNESNKQIFIAFDKKDSYNSKEIEEIIEKSKIIELSYGGNELFGRSWNQKSKS